MRCLMLTLLLSALAGCAGMDAEECRATDWRAIGYEDGVRGQSAAGFGPRREACAEHGVAADLDAYLAGRALGLEEYCRPQNGYRLGSNGHEYAGVCPARLEASFLAAHADGYGLYERAAALGHIGKRLRHSEERAEEIEYLLVERTALLASPHLPLTKRASIAVEIKQLAAEKVELRQAIHQLEQEYAAAEDDYEAYRRRDADRDGG